MGWLSMLALCNALASHDARGSPIHPLFAATLLALAATEASGQDASKEASLPEITINAAPSVAQKYQLPATTESVTAEQMAETINVMNTEDALKYLPSLIVRKRNFGDQQA